MSTPGAHVTALLGVWALDACDPDETDLVAAHVRQCPSCAREAVDLQQTVAMIAELVELDEPDSAEVGSPPPPSDVLTAALARRRPAPSVPAFAAPFAAAAGLLESAFAELDDAAWTLPSPVRD